MRIEIDFDEKHITVKEIDHYIELEKRMKELFGQDRIDWKITFSQEITTGNNHTFGGTMFSPPGGNSGNITYQGGTSGTINTSGLSVNTAFTNATSSDTFFKPPSDHDMTGKPSIGSSIGNWGLSDLLPGKSNKKDNDNE